MTNVDDKIRTALSADDEEFLKNLEGERGLFTQLGATFNGPMRMWTWVAGVFVFAATGAGLYALWQLFQADTTRLQILWAVGVWAAWTMQVALKQWLFDRMNHLAVLRELKRLELRVAQLSKG